MNYSSKTLIIGRVIFFSLSIIGALTISILASDCKEEKITLKLFGYTMLTAFKFKLNSVYLPLGPIIAFLMIKKTSKNKKAKAFAIALGISLLIFPYKSTLNKIEDSLYPRTNIKTYLVGERSHGGIATIFYAKDGNSLPCFTADILDNDIETADMIYNELLNCKFSSMSWIFEYDYYFRLNQDIDDSRFTSLDFKVSADAKQLQLEYENKTYIFDTSEEFQKIFKDIMDVD